MDEGRFPKVESRKRYPEEVCREAVRVVRESGETVAQVAAGLGRSRETLRR